VHASRVFGYEEEWVYNEAKPDGASIGFGKGCFRKIRFLVANGSCSRLVHASRVFGYEEEWVYNEAKPDGASIVLGIGCFRNRCLPFGNVRLVAIVAKKANI